MSSIEKTLTHGVQRGIFAAPDVAAILARIAGTSRFEDLAAVDLVVEAVFEDLGIKKNAYLPALDEACQPRHQILRRTRLHTP